MLDLGDVDTCHQNMKVSQTVSHQTRFGLVVKHYFCTPFTSMFMTKLWKVGRVNPQELHTAFWFSAKKVSNTVNFCWLNVKESQSLSGTLATVTTPPGVSGR